MPEYLSPGVYVEEIDAGPKPIEGVSTSTAGAVGVTAFGPTAGKPELVTSFAEFTRKFGGFLPEPSSAVVNQWALNSTEGGRWWLFPLAVKGFFDNGGQRLYVKRVFSASAVASAGTLGQGLIAEIEQDAAATATSVKVRHLFDMDVGTTVDLVRGDNATFFPNNPFTVSRYNATTRTVWLTPAAGAGLGLAASVARGDHLVIRTIRTAAANATLRFAAKARGAWGDDLSVRVRPVAGSSLNILADLVIGGAVWSTTLSGNAASGDTVLNVAANAGVTVGPPADRILIDGAEYTVAALPAGQITIAAPGLLRDAPAGTAVKRLRPAYRSAAAGTDIRAWGANALYPGAIVELDNGREKETLSVVSVSGDVVTLSANLANNYWEGHKLRVVEAEVAVSYKPGGLEQASESFSGLRLVADGSMSYLLNHVNERSALVQVSSASAANFPLPAVTNLAGFPITTGVVTPDGIWQELSGGSDALSSLSVDDFVGIDGGSGNRTGIQALEDIDEVSHLPGAGHVVVDRPLGADPALRDSQGPLRDPRSAGRPRASKASATFREPLDTKYAALYYPWIEVRDPSVEAQRAGRAVRAHGRHLRARGRRARRAQGAGQRSRCAASPRSPRT